MPKMFKAGSTDPQAKKRMQKERAITIVMMLFIFGFVLSWYKFFFETNLKETIFNRPI
jgi:hypothetical protein